MLKVKGFGVDPFVTVGLFVQWVIGNVGVGRARGPGGGAVGTICGHLGSC